MSHAFAILTCLPLLLAARQNGLLEEREAARAQRRAEALASEKSQHAEVLAALTPDWTYRESDRFLVLTHTDPKETERVLEQAEAVLGYIEERFDCVGKGEYVRRPILRICRDPEERAAIERARGSATWLPRSLEILGCWDPRGALGYEFLYLNRALLRHFLKERSSELYLALPPWLQHGLLTQVEGLRVGKYGKLELLRDDWDADELTVQTQHGRGLSPRELLRLTEAKLGTGSESKKYAQSDALVRYLLSDECAKGTRTLLVDYLSALERYAGEHRARMIERAAELAEAAREQEADEPEAEEKAESVDPEELAARWRRKAWLDAEADLVEDLWSQLLDSFEEKEWKSFEKSYAKFID